MRNLLFRKTLIFSLQTFCKNMKYLKSCVKVVERLLNSRIQQIVCFITHEIFKRTRLNSSTITFVSFENDFIERYRKLWIFAIRYFFNFVNVTLKKKSDENKFIIKKLISIIQYCLTRLIMRLRFNSFVIRKLKFSRKLSKVLRHILKSILNYVINDKLINIVIRKIKQRTIIIININCIDISSQFIIDEYDLNFFYKCKRCFEFFQTKIENSLFIHWIYNAMKTRNRYFMSFYIHRIIFRVFLENKKFRLIFSDVTYFKLTFFNVFKCRTWIINFDEFWILSVESRLIRIIIKRSNFKFI